METMTVKNLYDSFIRMTPAEQHDFISRINDYENQTVEYAADGRPLTRIQYRERVHAGSLNMPKGIIRVLKSCVKRLVISMQNYKVVFSDLAIADLNDIVQYITENESYTRAKYVECECMQKGDD